MLRPRIWLMATVAAIFALQAPLCALACLDSSVAAGAAAQEAEHPCHEQSRGSTPADTPTSHEGSGCDLGCEALLVGSDTPSNLPTLAVVTPTASAEAFYSGLISAPAVPKEADLPPPDILLLKSTLLI